ncbi:MAG: hypothetical protein ACUVQ6_02755 [Dissulfurimicrobium sp.]|uniref:hypothetical protein n=1 Tax=Dissulfurimicrobium sp. TaxID=2022436 RepID=UPI00404B6AE6
MTIRRTLWSYEKTDDQRRAAMEFTEDLITEIAPWADGLYIIREVSSALVKIVRNACFKESGRATE